LGRRIGGLLLLSLSATVAGAALSACASPGRPAVVTVVESAASSTAHVGSFHLSGQDKTVETNHPSVVESSATMTGLVDLAHKRSKETQTDTTPASSQGLIQAPQGAAPIPPPPPAETTTTITIGRDMWISTPDPSGGSGSQWLHLPLPSCAATFGLSPFDDPTQLFARLSAGLHDVTNVGTQTISGVSTDHYTGTATWPLPPDMKAGADAKLKIDVWVDASGLVRQVSMITHLPGISMGNGPTTPPETSYSTAQFFDFGSPVTIQPPPPNQVFLSPNGLNLVKGCPASHG
jgi:hypothetical protein